MPLRNPKRGKREHAEGQKRGARKSPKIVRNWAIGEGCESKKSKVLGMRACHARGREMD